MHCGRCGGLIDDEYARFCGCCGKPLEQVKEPPVSTEADSALAVPAGQAIGTPAPAKKRKLDNRQIGIIVCSVILIAVVITGIWLFTTDSPEAVLRQVITAGYQQDTNTIAHYTVYNFDHIVDDLCASASITAQDLSKILLEKEDVSTLRELYDKKKSEGIAALTARYGSAYTIAFDIINEAPLSAREFKNTLDIMESRITAGNFAAGNIVNRNSITQMVDYKVITTITGSRDSDTRTAVFTLAKIGGSWRLYMDYSDYMEMLDLSDYVLLYQYGANFGYSF
ncbi:MAG: hypothetical protein FWE80_09615 [Oscillospiraceae bacterium]|nr:hypothetical protein [Oscillospiraceae bacterium]